MVQLPLLTPMSLLERAERSPVMTSDHLARALTYASLVSTVEFNSSERSILNLLGSSVPKSQFCRQVKPGGQLIGEGLSPPSQVAPGVLVGDAVVGTKVVGAALVGMTVVGWEVGAGVAGFAEGAAVGNAEGATDGPTVVGLEEVGIRAVGFDEGDSVRTVVGDLVVGSDMMGAELVGLPVVG